MRAAAMLLALGLACDSDRMPPNWNAALTPTAAPDLTAIRTRAHAVMSSRCGSCHDSHRPSAKPAALAIFDLDQPDWHTHFDDARFATGLNRFSDAPPADREAFIALRDAELSRRVP